MNQLVKRLKKAQQRKEQQSEGRQSEIQGSKEQPTFNIYVDKSDIETASPDEQHTSAQAQKTEDSEETSRSRRENSFSEEDIASIVDRVVEQKYQDTSQAPSYADVEAIADRIADQKQMQTNPAITPEEIERIVKRAMQSQQQEQSQPASQEADVSTHTSYVANTGRTASANDASPYFASSRTHVRDAPQQLPSRPQPSMREPRASSSNHATSNNPSTYVSMNDRDTAMRRPARLDRSSNDRAVGSRPMTQQPELEQTPTDSLNTQETVAENAPAQPMQSTQPSQTISNAGIQIPQDQRIDYEGLGDDVEDDESIRDLDIKYPLIPQDAPSQEESYAWAHITYDRSEDSLVYRVNEPPLPEPLEEKLQSIEDILKESLDVSFDELKHDEAKRFLTEKVAEVIDSHHFDMSHKEREIIEYYAYRNFIGLGKIEPIMNDKNIEDVSCDGYNIPLYVYHRHPKIGSLKTNVVFEDESELDSFVIKLSQRCGRTVSVAEPLLDGSLPDGSRVQATLGTDIARRGSNFTIRRFTDEPLTPIHLLNFGTIDATMLAYLWLAIEHGKSVLISGPTASGKTSMLNAMSLFIQPEMKIVSIEDTPELRLPHPNWVPEVSRSGFGFGATQSGEVTLDDLLKESLRQRPDFIIVGEVRGEEAYILFQQIATGHPGLSTIHASSLDKVVDRLTTDPINLSPTLLENLDIMMIMKTVRQKGSYIRRVDSMMEIEDFDTETADPYVNAVFNWDAHEDQYYVGANSSVLSAITEDSGLEEEEVKQELAARREIIQWMQDTGIRSYEKVGKIIQLYYSDPAALLRYIGR